MLRLQRLWLRKNDDALFEGVTYRLDSQRPRAIRRSIDSADMQPPQRVFVHAVFGFTGGR